MGLQAIDGDALSDKRARNMGVSRWTREIEDSKLARDGTARAIQMSLGSMAGTTNPGAPTLLTNFLFLVRSIPLPALHMS